MKYKVGDVVEFLEGRNGPCEILDIKDFEYIVKWYKTNTKDTYFTELMDSLYTLDEKRTKVIIFKNEIKDIIEGKE